MINIGSHQLPSNAATKTFAVLAKKGAGKTYTGGVLAEEFYKDNIPFVVFDPIDVWWGLRFGKNGKDKGLPIVVFGLEHADIILQTDKKGKLEPEIGRKIARSVVKSNISCIISTFGISKNNQRLLITEFAEELLKINNTPRHIFIEEAHEFVPQKVFGEMGRVFNAVSNLVVMGRNRGLGVTMLNQRAATINKDVLTQIDTLIAMRNTSPQDRKALKEWVEYHAAEGDFDKFIQSLPELPNGQGWIWSPEFLGIFEKIKIRERETLHPDREKLGEQFEMPQLEQMDIQEFINSFNKESKAERGVTAARDPHEVQESKFDSSRSDRLIQDLKNEYESKLIAKDAEIRMLHNKLRQIEMVLGMPINSIRVETAQRGTPNSSIQIWLDKFGNSLEGKVMKFLFDNYPRKFTREQLALALGASYNTLKNSTIPKVKRTLCVKEENRELFVNPNL